MIRSSDAKKVEIMNPDKYVVFSLGQEQYGLPIENIEQILSNSPVTRIPKTAKEILGVFNLRGETLAVVDTRAILNVEDSEDGCFLVVSIGGTRAAMVADKVNGIYDLAENQIQMSSGMASGQVSNYTGRIDDKLVVLLQPEALIPTRVAVDLSTAVAVA
jgi:purine-binding chemotaxis protein CheW